MVALGRLEKRINSDPNLRKAFLADPVGALRREGIIIPLDKQRALRTTVANAQKGGTTSPSGVLVGLLLTAIVMPPQDYR